MNIIKKSWDDISINDYRKISQIIEDDSIEDIDKTVYLLSIISDKTEEEIYNTPLNELSQYTKSLQFINSFDFNKKKNIKHIKINKWDCDIDYNLQKFTVAQYVDFQHYWDKDKIKENLEHIVACFVIPKGKKLLLSDKT